MRFSTARKKGRRVSVSTGVSNLALLSDNRAMDSVGMCVCKRGEMTLYVCDRRLFQYHLAQVREVRVTGHEGAHPRARVRQHQRLVRWVHSQPAVDGVARSPHSLHHTDQFYFEDRREGVCV